MNKRVRRFLFLLLFASLSLQSLTVASGQRSKGVIGRHQVLIINNSSRQLGFEAMTPRGRLNCQLVAGDDVVLENVKLIRVAGTEYSLEFKNRYALLWDAQGARPYVRRLVKGN